MGIQTGVMSLCALVIYDKCSREPVRIPGRKDPATFPTGSRFVL